MLTQANKISHHLHKKCFAVLENSQDGFILLYIKKQYLCF